MFNFRPDMSLEDIKAEANKSWEYLWECYPYLNNDGMVRLNLAAKMSLASDRVQTLDQLREELQKEAADSDDLAEAINDFIHFYL